MSLKQITTGLARYLLASGLTRGSRLLLLTALCLFLLLIPAFLIERSSGVEVNLLQSRMKEFAALSSEYRSMKERIDAVEKKTSLIKVSGVVQAVDEIFSSLGLRGRVKSVKSAGTRELRGGITEDRADVLVEKVTMNEMVNIFSKAENSQLRLSIKKAGMKKSFENPELLDLALTISLFSSK